MIPSLLPSHAPGWTLLPSESRSKIIKWPLTRPRHPLCRPPSFLLISITGPHGGGRGGGGRESGPRLQADQSVVSLSEHSGRRRRRRRSIKPGVITGLVAARLIGRTAQDRTPGPRGRLANPLSTCTLRQAGRPAQGPRGWRLEPAVTSRLRDDW